MVKCECSRVKFEISSEGPIVIRVGPLAKQFVSASLKERLNSSPDGIACESQEIQEVAFSTYLLVFLSPRTRSAIIVTV